MEQISKIRPHMAGTVLLLFELIVLLRVARAPVSNICSGLCTGGNEGSVINCTQRFHNQILLTFRKEKKQSKSLK